MTTVLTHLTFQHHRAGEAVEFYTSLVEGSSIDSRTPVGEGREMITFTLGGRPFMAADSPPVHEWDFTPAMSMFLLCDTTAELDRLFTALSDGGVVFMPVANYGFNPHFGWCRDRYGVSWQLMLDPAGGVPHSAAS